MNNGKKEFPIDGGEEDVCSKYGRTIYCYIRNGKGVAKYAKNKMNRRFRRFNKSVADNELETIESDSRIIWDIKMKAID